MQFNLAIGLCIPGGIFIAYLRSTLDKEAPPDGPAEDPKSEDDGLGTVSTGSEELAPGEKELGRIKPDTVDIGAAVGLGVSVLPCSGLDQGAVGSVARGSAEILSSQQILPR